MGWEDRSCLGSTAKMIFFSFFFFYLLTCLGIPFGVRGKSYSSSVLLFPHDLIPLIFTITRFHICTSPDLQDLSGVSCPRQRKHWPIVVCVSELGLPSSFSCKHRALMTSNKLKRCYVQLKRPDTNEDKLWCHWYQRSAQVTEITVMVTHGEEGAYGLVSYKWNIWADGITLFLIWVVVPWGYIYVKS